MRFFFMAALAGLFLSRAIFAADVPNPAKVPTPLTEAQKARLTEGMTLHDAGRFEDALALYDAILQENPGAAQVLAEACLSGSASGSCEKVLVYALRGAQYKSSTTVDELIQ